MTGIGARRLRSNLRLLLALGLRVTNPAALDLSVCSVRIELQPAFGFHLPAMAQELPLTWFPVQREIAWAGGQTRTIVQFEQLIGQATEHIDSVYIEVDRNRRFLPIKTRDDLRAAEGPMRERIARAREAAGR